MLCELTLTGVVDLEDPGKDDFELWSPSEERDQLCLFGRQVRCLKPNFPFVFTLISRADALPSPETKCELRSWRQTQGTKRCRSELPVYARGL